MQPIHRHFNYMIWMRKENILTHFQNFKKISNKLMSVMLMAFMFSLKSDAFHVLVIILSLQSHRILPGLSE